MQKIYQKPVRFSLALLGLISLAIGLTYYIVVYQSEDNQTYRVGRAVGKIDHEKDFDRLKKLRSEKSQVFLGSLALSVGDESHINTPPNKLLANWLGGLVDRSDKQRTKQITIFTNGYYDGWK